MCGIVGCVRSGEAARLVLAGLRKLEYRGYDSAGIAVPAANAATGAGGGATSLRVVRRAGDVGGLVAEAKAAELSGDVAIAHTRWATHGAPTATNAHPHTDCRQRIAVAHNGVVENWRQLRDKLTDLGCKFRTDTDSEVIPHLIERLFAGDLAEATAEAMALIKGAAGVVVVSDLAPGQIVALRRSAPLLLAAERADRAGKESAPSRGIWTASDLAAVIDHAREVSYLEDGDVAVISADGWDIRNAGSTFGSVGGRARVTRPVKEVPRTMGDATRSGHDHFMIKEIHEQPETLRDVLRGRLTADGRVALGGMEPVDAALDRADRIVLTACGTSWHAALVGEYIIEELARIPVEVEYASEFRYRGPVLDRERTVVGAISQSGETADTLAALRLATSRGVPTFGIVNSVASSLARESGAGVYTRAGPEIGVASTKAFTSQVLALVLLGLRLAGRRGLDSERRQQWAEALTELPALAAEALAAEAEVKRIARRFAAAGNFLYLGRGPNFPIALEGALKLKEISYIHAEGYPAAEMKHGPIALIDEDMPAVFLATRDPVYSKVVMNLEEVRARGGRVVAVVSTGDRDLEDSTDALIEVPDTMPLLQPVINVIPLQLLAYHIAVMRGCDVDRPRNLAKSVTVE